MENASKALIIAGAILLSILIISTGMYIYNSSQNSISGAVSQISQHEIDAFNRQWEMYEGKQTGSNVRALIAKMNSNATENAEEETKLPDLYCEYASERGIIIRSTVGVTLVKHVDTGLISGIVITYVPTVDATKLRSAGGPEANDYYREFAGID